MGEPHIKNICFIKAWANYVAKVLRVFLYRATRITNIADHEVPFAKKVDFALRGALLCRAMRITKTAAHEVSYDKKVGFALRGVFTCFGLKPPA